MYKAGEGREDNRKGNRYQMTNFRMHCNKCIRTASQIQLISSTSYISTKDPAYSV